MTHEELRKRYNPDGSELRRAQLRMLEMLTFVDKVCSAHNINYWLDSGTLLGAARHGGFIPWDDDVDICMTYQDMLRFKDLMLHEYSGHTDYVLQCRETDKNIFCGWVILRDLKSEGISDAKIHNLYKYRGLNVDIFPVTDRSLGVLQVASNLLYKVFVKAPLKQKPVFKYFRWLSPPIYRLFYHIVLPCFRMVSHPFKRRFYRMIYGCEFTSKRYIEDIWPLSRMRFEGIQLSVPHDSDAYLRRMYGDWRKLPDEIQTHNYHVKFLD